MNDYEKTIEIMKEKFGMDYQFALATINGQEPSLRIVDTYFNGQYFYIVTDKRTRKVQNILENPNVSLCSRFGYVFNGKARLVGHPLDESNKEIREKLIKAFESWYFKHNDESVKTMCYIQIELTDGFFFHQQKGYQMNFIKKEVNIFPYLFVSVLTKD